MRSYLPVRLRLLFDSAVTVDESKSSGSGEIPPFRMVLALLGPVVVILLSVKLKLKIESKLLVSLVRSITQLLLAGYFLLKTIFSLHNPVWVVLYLFMMLLIAALEATARQVRTYNGHYFDSLMAVLAGGALVGAYGSIVVFNPDPWWEPHIMIPTCGMIIGNAISGPAVSVDRLLSEVSEKKYESETRLAFGSSQYEAVLPVVRAAILAALLPNLNQMAVIGLVSIPGMMTGQLLGGASPLVAAEYQMAIIWLICTTAAVSTYVAVSLAIRHAVFDKCHRLTPSKIIKRAKGNMSIETALWKFGEDTVLGIVGVVKKGCCEWRLHSHTAHSYEVLAGVEVTTNSITKVKFQEPLLPTNSQTAPPVESSGGLRTKVSYEIVENENNCSPSQGQPLSSVNLDLGGYVIMHLANFNVKSGEEGRLFPLTGITLSIRAGERITFEGPSGIGKTRLLRAMAQLDEPLQGSSQVCAGQGLLTSFSAMSAPEWRCRVIYIPQALPPLAGTPAEFISECCQYDSRRQHAAAKFIIRDLEDISRDIERQLLLESGKMNQSWAALSGGERQRAAIGCALVLSRSLQSQIEWDSRRKPEVVLLLDEPTAACDAVSCSAVEQAIINCGAACVLITHDDRQAVRLAHRRIILTATAITSDTAAAVSISNERKTVLNPGDMADV